MVFNGKNPHSGVEVTSGVRYILTGFINHYNKKYPCLIQEDDHDDNYDGSGGGSGDLKNGDILKYIKYTTTDGCSDIITCNPNSDDNNGSSSSGGGIDDISKWIPKLKSNLINLPGFNSFTKLPGTPSL